VTQTPSTSAVRLSAEMLETNVREWGALSDLIGQIYECAIDPTQWDDTLALIVHTLSPADWDVAMLLWESASPPRGRFVAAAGVGPIIRQVYCSTFAGQNPWHRHISRQPLGRVVDTFDIMSRSELVEHPLYRNFLGAWGLERAVGVMLDRNGAERLGLILPGKPDRDLSGLKRGLRLLAPHLQRAVRFSHALGEANLRAQAAASALESAPVAVVTLRLDSTVMSANSKAAGLAKAGWISLRDGRFAFADRHAQNRLTELIAAAPPTSAAFVARGPDGEQIAVLGARMNSQQVAALAGPLDGAAVVLTLGVDTGAPLLQIDRLGAWYGLTPSEARLAAGLASGETLIEYAGKRNVSVNSVRFLLKGVYRKTGATAQAQLVAMLRSLPQE
jgi:DNA-binding CsgD family transcriptional regulator